MRTKSNGQGTQNRQRNQRKQQSVRQLLTKVCTSVEFRRKGDAGSQIRSQIVNCRSIALVTTTCVKRNFDFQARKIVFRNSSWHEQIWSLLGQACNSQPGKTCCARGQNMLINSVLFHDATTQNLGKSKTLWANRCYGQKQLFEFRKRWLAAPFPIVLLTQKHRDKIRPTICVKENFHFQQR